MSKGRIFVVEDDFIRETAVIDSLKKEGFEVMTGSGDDIASKVVAAKPDIIVTNVNISDPGNEVALLEEFRGREELKGCEFFIYTSRMDVTLEVQLRRLKLDNFFTRDTDIATFIKSVNRHFSTDGKEEVIDLLELDAEKGERQDRLDHPEDYEADSYEYIANTSDAAPPPPKKTKQSDTQVGEVLSEFSEKVHKQLGDQDGETYYNLGVSYMEMGLFEEALKEFASAVKDSQFVTEALAMSGVCLRNLKKHALAIQKFQQGAKLSRDPKEKLGFWYEIGITLFELKRHKEAYNFLAAVYKADNAYRDAKERLIQIKRILQTGRK